MHTFTPFPQWAPATQTDRAPDKILGAEPLAPLEFNLSTVDRIRADLARGQIERLRRQRNRTEDAADLARALEQMDG